MPLNYSLGSEEGSLDEGEISPSTYEVLLGGQKCPNAWVLTDIDKKD